ncbi:fimbrillin family protein [Parabacteroides sp.]
MDSKQIKWIICGLIGFLLSGCQDDLNSPDTGKDRRGIPVRFTTELPQDGKVMTRSTTAITDKTEFKNGDVMHVSAVFTLDEQSSSENTVTKYAALRWNEEEEEWVDLGEAEGQYMDWPWNAKSATFTAYHMEEWDGPIIPDEPVTPIVLDRFAYDKVIVNPDPLKAESQGSVEYGHAVHLQFKHLCTRLTITDVGDENEYWLTIKAPGPDKNLKNACTIQRSTTNELTFEFTEQEDTLHINPTNGEANTIIKVSSQVAVDEKGKRSVTFHLEPRDYSNFTLTRRDGYGYITLSGIQNEEQEGFRLDAGNSYTISLQDLSGNITPDDMDEDWWGENGPGDTYKDFDVQTFMDHIESCNEDYICAVPGMPEQSFTLLKYDPYLKEMKLMTDVDFQEKEFNAVNLHSINTFNGGGHTIQNIKHPMFDLLEGKVIDLKLADVNLEHINANTSTDDPDHDTTWGALAHICAGGEISDVTLENATINIVLHNQNATADKSYNVGALVGWVKAGKLSNISLRNKIEVTVSASDNESVYLAAVGGVIGQCNGTLERIDYMGTGSDDDAIKVTNTCKGYASRYTGGIVGLLSDGSINGCDVRTIVDASKAYGTWNYAGGVAGGIRVTGSGQATISDPRITGGKVTGGRAIVRSGETSHSSVGGIVGHLQNASVTNGLVTNKVSIKQYTHEDGTIYYTIGGVIGSITNPREIRKNEGANEFDATSYAGWNNYIAGTFSGGGGDEDKLIEDLNETNGKGSFVGQSK